MNKGSVKVGMLVKISGIDGLFPVTQKWDTRFLANETFFRYSGYADTYNSSGQVCMIATCPEILEHIDSLKYSRTCEMIDKISFSGSYHLKVKLHDFLSEFLFNAMEGGFIDPDSDLINLANDTEEIEALNKLLKEMRGEKDE